MNKYLIQGGTILIKTEKEHKELETTELNIIDIEEQALLIQADFNKFIKTFNGFRDGLIYIEQDNIKLITTANKYYSNMEGTYFIDNVIKDRFIYSYLLIKKVISLLGSIQKLDITKGILKVTCLNGVGYIAGKID